MISDFGIHLAAVMLAANAVFKKTRLRDSEAEGISKEHEDTMNDEDESRRSHVLISDFSSANVEPCCATWQVSLRSWSRWPAAPLPS